jgi:hypothetical protein
MSMHRPHPSPRKGCKLFFLVFLREFDHRIPLSHTRYTTFVVVPYRRRYFCCGVSLFFVEQGPKYIRKQCLFVDDVRLSQIGFVATGALSRGWSSYLGLPT